MLAKPDASITNGDSGALAAGTKQTVPTGGLGLIDITHNLGTDGSTPGEGIQFVDPATMNDLNPDWRTDTAVATVQNYIYNPKDPLNYEVYPQQPGSSQGHVNIIYSITPADPATIAAAITLADIYEPVIIDIMLSLAYAVSSDQSPFAWERSQVHWNLAMQAIGRADMMQMKNAPRPK